MGSPTISMPKPLGSAVNRNNCYPAVTNSIIPSDKEIWLVASPKKHDVFNDIYIFKKNKYSKESEEKVFRDPYTN